MDNEITNLAIWLPLSLLWFIWMLSENWAILNRHLKRKFYVKHRIYEGDHYWDADVTIFAIWTEYRRMVKAVITKGEGVLLKFNDSRKLKGKPFNDH